MISITAACIARANHLDENKIAITRIITKGGYSSYEITKLITTDANDSPGKTADLTSRQVQILRHWVLEYSLEKSATELGIGIGTIKSQRNKINKRFEKAGYRSPIDYARHISLVHY